MSDQPEETPAPRFQPGTLVVYRDADDRRSAYLAITAKDPTWWENTSTWGYGLHYVQFPEYGRPSGGSSWSTAERDLRLPETAAEVLAAARYHAHARVLAAESELAAAERERDAVETVVSMVERAAVSS